MTKRLSVIATLVCSFAIVCGLLFGGGMFDSYELKNGPGLLSPKFFELIEKNKEGIQFENIIINSLNVPAPVKNFVMITSAPVGNQPASTMGIYSDSKGAFTIQASNSQNPYDMAGSYLVKDLTLKEVNKRIDKAFFPNENKRKVMKEDIIKILEDTQLK